MSEPSSSISPRLVLCACPDAGLAERLAEAVVGERLAACVNILPGLRSVYRWRGALERAEETLLLIKTAGDRLPELTARLRALHPHELPEIVAVELDGGLAPYLDWIVEETRAPESDRVTPHSQKDRT